MKSSKEIVKIVSFVAPNLDSKTLNEIFNYLKGGQKVSCSSYEIAEARLHFSQHGAAATSSKESELLQQCALAQNGWRSWLSSRTAQNEREVLL